MPSTINSQTQNKATHRKSDRSSRKITTLSFEKIDRTRRGIFTENISASSRLPRPAYVVREDDVMSANMPDTIRLAKHRSKIYVGLSEPTSGYSTNRSQRTTSRERTSAGTTISKASIIDWTDSASEISSPNGLSGEFSAILPPVAGAKPDNDKPPPGLDTIEILNYRSVIHKKRIDNRSPRPPPSRGNVPRVPHNTPFPAMTRPDEFAATFRKKVTHRKTPLDNCNVVLLGGSITPLSGSRESRSKNIIYREPSFLDNKKYRKEIQQTNVANVGLPRFDLPMIDLKCVESPIANLGDLEEKGIRLVRLRRMKKKKPAQPNNDRNGQAEDGNLLELENDSTTVNEPTQAKIADHVTSTESNIPPLNTQLVASNNVEIAVNDFEAKRRQSVITTPSSFTEGKEKVDNNDEKQTELLLSNREQYATPLLPDVDATCTPDNPPKCRSSYDEKLTLVGKSPRQTTGLTVPVISNVEKINTTDQLGGSTQILLTVEKFDTTPTPVTPLGINLIEDKQTVSPEEVPKNRLKKRSSSLLTVPDSIRQTERRPPAHDENEITDFVVDTEGLDAEIRGVFIDNPLEERRLSREEETREGRRSVTVATQTSSVDIDE